MTIPDYELTSAMGGAQAVIDAAVRSADPAPIGDHLFGVVVPAGSTLQQIDTTATDEKYADRPRRKKGAFEVHDADSFVSYLHKHGTSTTEVWADTQSARIVGVINAHDAEVAGWGDHRVSYSVKHTPAWKAWTQHDGKLLSQSAFAEHIEDRMIDIVYPTAADMLELAQSFQATIGVSFQSSKLLSSGERELTYKETVDATAGRTRTLEIPKEFELGLIPFEGAVAFKVIARFRYRINDGSLSIGYRLNRPEDVLRDAFDSVVAQIVGGVECPVYLGVSAT